MELSMSVFCVYMYNIPKHKPLSRLALVLCKTLGHQEVSKVDNSLTE